MKNHIGKHFLCNDVAFWECTFAHEAPESLYDTRPKACVLAQSFVCEWCNTTRYHANACANALRPLY